MAKQLLAYERVDSAADAAAQVYDKLRAELDPLLGAFGAQALFTRTLKLIGRDHTWLDDRSIIESSAKFRQTLLSKDQDVAAEAASVFFGTFIALSTTMIGARLTHQILRRAWPAIEDLDAEETPK